MPGPRAVEFKGEHSAEDIIPQLEIGDFMRADLQLPRFPCGQGRGGFQFSIRLVIGGKQPTRRTCSFLTLLSRFLDSRESFPDACELVIAAAARKPANVAARQFAANSENTPYQ